MTINEIFEKYTDDRLFFYRKNIENLKLVCLAQLKVLRRWCKTGDTGYGFHISKEMVEDNNANDWELFEERIDG